MEINGKIWSYSNLIDILNKGWKGLTLELPTTPPLKWKSKAMNWDIIVIERIIQKYINIIYNGVGAANFMVLIPKNKFPFRAIYE